MGEEFGTSNCMVVTTGGKDPASLPRCLVIISTRRACFSKLHLEQRQPGATSPKTNSANCGSYGRQERPRPVSCRPMSADTRQEPWGGGHWVASSNVHTPDSLADVQCSGCAAAGADAGPFPPHWTGYTHQVPVIQESSQAGTRYSPSTGHRAAPLDLHPAPGVGVGSFTVELEKRPRSTNAVARRWGRPPPHSARKARAPIRPCPPATGRRSTGRQPWSTFVRIRSERHVSH